MNRVYVVICVDREDGNVSSDVYSNLRDAMDHYEATLECTRDDLIRGDDIVEEQGNDKICAYFRHEDKYGAPLYECIVREEVVQ